MALRKMLVQFSELVFFVALECQICAALAKAQPAQPSLRMSSAFPNAGGALEDTQGSCMMERRLQRKFEWTELPAVLAEGLLRLNGAGVELAESVFSSDDTGTFTPYKLRIVMHGGATKRPARFRILLDPPYVWINAARRRGDIDLCAG